MKTHPNYSSSLSVASDPPLTVLIAVDPHPKAPPTQPPPDRQIKLALDVQAGDLRMVRRVDGAKPQSKRRSTASLPHRSHSHRVSRVIVAPFALPTWRLLGEEMGICSQQSQSAFARTKTGNYRLCPTTFGCCPTPIRSDSGCVESSLTARVKATIPKTFAMPDRLTHHAATHQFHPPILAKSDDDSVALFDCRSEKHASPRTPFRAGPNANGWAYADARGEIRVENDP